jgi:ADP-ribose pyrophosphatase
MNIPERAKRVFDGIIFDIYQWEQEMFDGSTRTFEMADLKSAVLVIVPLQGERILVIEQEQPNRPHHITLPGGHIEKGETPESAARKELREETGYIAENLELFKESFGMPKFRFAESVFIARGAKKGAEQALGAGERVLVKDVSFDEFLLLARDKTFSVSFNFRWVLYEALIDPSVKETLRATLFEK